MPPYRALGRPAPSSLAITYGLNGLRAGKRDGGAEARGEVMDPDRGAGRFLLLFCTAAFGVGVLVSALSPNWIVVEPPRGSAFEEVAWGPFYGYYRACARNAGGGAASCAVAWRGMRPSDCRAAGDGVSDEFCNHLAASRSLAIVCLFLLVAGGASQAKNSAVTSCCDAVTRGASGRFSHKRIGTAIWCLEVCLSVVAWCFALSSLSILRRVSDVKGAGAMWPLWLFIASATGMGSFAALMTNWAARREESDDDGYLDEPLMMGA